MAETHERFQWAIGVTEAGGRLDRFLTEREVLGTRSQIRHLVTGGLVRVDGKVAKAGILLRSGQEVVVLRPRRTASTIEPQDIALDILFEDATILAVNKPPGLVVHPAPGHSRGTLVNALLHHWKEPLPGLDPTRPGIVHRLDKDTSGVLLVAKDVVALAELGRQFRQREIRKCYVAIVWGCLQPPRGMIDLPIARHPVDRKRMAARARGREAVTRYEVLETLPGVSLVRAFPETGRTHQIRVHFAALGHPVVADRVYARGRGGNRLGLHRHALHAESIRFRHPVTREEMTLQAPLPEDLATAMRDARETGLTS